MTQRLPPASCSVVCYNNPAPQLERVLASVTASLPSIRPYVVDNSARPALAPVARRHGAHYSHLPHNPGYGSGHNHAIGEALAHGSAYHFVLNPDIYIAAGDLGAMLQFMERHRDVGLMSPRVHYPDGRLQPLCKLLPNPADMLLRRLLPALHRGSGRQALYELHHSGYDRLMDVPALSGCFLLLRTDVIRQVGLFDERFFLYFEDVDLSRRIGRVARTVYFPRLQIVHDYARGSYRQPRLFWHHAVSALRYFNKWGWFRDPERSRVNGRALRLLHRDKTVPGKARDSRR
jgi:GT2 family glycosyltransferase